ncbi:hypothetical protein STRNTR1_3839 [Stenotrophomonas maltophilia]|nr:hypothetical protein STRNTR1_3839 [Stenotrophomonas maltophilia]
MSRAGLGPALSPVAVRVGARRGNPCIVAFSAARGKAAPYAAVLHAGNAVIHPRPVWMKRGPVVTRSTPCVMGPTATQ